jgi:hypothetical protein
MIGPGSETGTKGPYQPGLHTLFSTSVHNVEGAKKTKRHTFFFFFQWLVRGATSYQTSPIFPSTAVFITLLPFGRLCARLVHVPLQAHLINHLHSKTI